MDETNKYPGSIELGDTSRKLSKELSSTGGNTSAKEDGEGSDDNPTENKMGVDVEPETVSSRSETEVPLGEPTATRWIDHTDVEDLAVPGPSDTGGAVVHGNIMLHLDDDDDSITSNRTGDDAETVVLEDADTAQTDVGLLMLQSGSPPGLECLLDADQLVAHMGNLRYNRGFSDTAQHRMELVDITKRLILSVEQEPDPFDETSFLFRGYNKEKEEVLQIYNPGSNTCLHCGINWHWFKRCHYQTLVYAPPGTIAGFVRRRHTCFVQEFEILDCQENVIMRLRGAPTDLEIYSPDLENELGRLGRRWMGIMFELARSRQDYGITFPLDLDVRFKAVLIGAVFTVYWLYNRR